MILWLGVPITGGTVLSDDSIRKVENHSKQKNHPAETIQPQRQEN